MVSKLDKIKQRLSSTELRFEKEGVYSLLLVIEDLHPYIADWRWMVDLKVLHYEYATDLDGRPIMVNATLVPLASIENLFHNRIMEELYHTLKHYGIDSYAYRLMR